MVSRNLSVVGQFRPASRQAKNPPCRSLLAGDPNNVGPELIGFARKHAPTAEELCRRDAAAQRPRLTVKAVLTLALALLAVPACRKSAEPARTADGVTAVRMHLDWYAQTEYGGYYQARERGYYRESSLNVEIIHGGPSVGVKEAVALGRAEFGCTDGNDVIVAIARKQALPIVIVAAEMQQNPQGIMFHNAHPVRTFEDLAGRDFMARPGSAWVDYFRRSRGINFNLLPVTTDLTSFLADETMVRQCFVTQEPHAAEQSGAKVGTLLIADSGYAPYRVIFTSRDFLVKHPEIVRAFVAASARGFNDLLEGDPAPAFGVLQQANPVMTPDIMNYSLGAMKRLRLVQGDAAKGERTGLITRERIAQQIEILGSLELLEKPVSVDDVAVFDFVP
jgi:NitT/TauT family transport system substrate-binding protein